MQNCKITIITSIDEMENTVVRDGKIDILEDSFLLKYQEENAEVTITIREGVVLIDRQGDYSLRLQLQEGKIHEASLGLGGAEGKLSIKTYRAKYVLERNIFKLSLRYDLIFTENEVQKTKLNLKAQIRNNRQ